MEGLTVTSGYRCSGATPGWAFDSQRDPPSGGLSDNVLQTGQWERGVGALPHRAARTLVAGSQRAGPENNRLAPASGVGLEGGSWQRRKTTRGERLGGVGAPG